MKHLIFLFLLFAGSPTIAQKVKETFYIYDSSWNAAANLKSSYYFMQVINYGDTLFVARSYKTNGSMVSQESFSDAKLTFPKGRFAWYDDKGRIDSTGIVKNNVRAGSWAFYNDTVGVDLSITYDAGREIERKDYKRKLITRGSGVQTFEDEKKYNDSLRAALPTLDEKEAMFEGGPKGYKRYLEKNLRAPENLVETGTVKVSLIINKEGKVEDIHLLRSVQYSADAEAFRVIGSMPAWTPAWQNGKNVHYRAIQYITFTVQ
jgi:hypothetical protein